MYTSVEATYISADPLRDTPSICVSFCYILAWRVQIEVD